MFYTDIKPPDDGKFIPDPKKIVDDIFIKKVESYMKWQKVETATISDKGKDNQITDVRRSKIHWMDNPEFERALVPIYKELATKIREINNIYWRYSIDGWEAFQYTEYDESYKGHYDWHSDIGPKIALENHARKISFSLGLNNADEYEGGELKLRLGTEDRDHSYKLNKGEVFVFPSWVLHKVTPVTKGFRKVIVGWGLGNRI